MSPFIYFSVGLLILASLLALWRGGYWEKAVAATLVAGAILSFLSPFDGVRPPWIVIAIDSGVFLILLYACLRSARGWIIFAAACQFLVVATHYVFVQNQALMQWAYVSAYYVWSIGLLLSLCVGSLIRRKPKIALGSDERREL